jgi:hypothetical protein
MKRFGRGIMTLVAVLSVWAGLASAADQKTFIMGYDPGLT